MKKLARFITAAVTALAVSLFGLTTLASATPVQQTGPWSYNSVYKTTWTSTKTINNNNVSVNNFNKQSAHTGHATVLGKTFGGSAFSGPATNWNNTSTNIYISN